MASKNAADQMKEAAAKAAEAVPINALEIQANEVPFSSSPIDVPSIFADDIKGSFVLNGVARLNLVELRMDLDGSHAKYRPVASLNIPATALKGWGLYFLTLAGGPAPEGTESSPPESKGV